MVGLGAQPHESTAEVGATEKGVRERGSICLDLRKVICVGCPGRITLWVGDVDDITTHLEEFWQIPPKDGPQTYRIETSEGTRW